MIARWQWLFAAIALLILLLLAMLTHGEAEQVPTPDLYAGIPLDKKLLELDKLALAEAYHNHVVKLWTVYVTDGAKQSQYIRTGLGIARRAYTEANSQIEAREKQLQP